MTTYWTPKTPLNSANFTSLLTTFPTDDLPQGVVAAIITTETIVSDGVDISTPNIILELGSTTSPIQYNGHYWRISILMNHATTVNAVNFQLSINGQIVVANFMNQGGGTLEYILDPLHAVLFDTPLRAGGSLYISWAAQIINQDSVLTIPASPNAFLGLYIEDLGLI